MQIFTAALISAACLWIAADGSILGCQLPTNCNNGTVGITNLLGNSGCNLACNLVCGAGSTSVCQSFEGATELLRGNATAQPTTATCQCQPPANSTCKAVVSNSDLSAANLLIFPTSWCASCNAIGVTNCFYDAVNYRFRCDCVYPGFVPC